MQEAAALRAIEPLVTAKVLGLGMFVAMSGLVSRHDRSVQSRCAAATRRPITASPSTVSPATSPTSSSSQYAPLGA